MYYFNLQDILEDAERALSKEELLVEHMARFGFSNRNSITRALNKLTKNGVVIVEKKSIINKNGVYWFYSLSK